MGTIKLKRSETAATAPSSLEYGEVAINITDKKIYIGNSSEVSTLIVDGNATTTEGIQDIASTLLTAGTHTGISVSYPDTNNAINLTNTGVLQFNTRTGNVSLTSGDVTTALGFTPQTYDPDLAAIASLAPTEGVLLKTGTDGWAIDTDTFWRNTNDGKNSGLDADLVHGFSGSCIVSDLSTGIIYGGVISINGSDASKFDITAGLAHIHSPGASISAYVNPSETVVTWAAQTGITTTNIATHDATYVYVNTSGVVQQQTAPFTNSDYQNKIIIGVLGHANRSVNVIARTKPVTRYANDRQYQQFIRAFSPLKLSGHIISANGTNLNLNRSSGVAFSSGSNYVTDPNNPSQVEDIAYNAGSIFTYHRDGSNGFVVGTGIASINPDLWDDNSGTLQTVTPNKYTIQRIFMFPGFSSFYGVYYGRAEYGSLSLARDNILLEQFSEDITTTENAIFLGWLIVKRNTTALNNTTDAEFVQSGLMRNTIGGGGGTTSLLDDLSDVTISSATNNDLLRYNNSTSQWVNTSISTLNIGVTSGKLSQFAATTSAELAGVISDETGSGNLVFATSPTLVTPVLGTPQSGTLTSCTGLPVSTGVSGLGTGVATFLTTPSSANLISAVTDETGTGALVFANTPTLVAPLLGTPTSGILTNCTALPLTTGVTGTLDETNGGTGLTSFATGDLTYASATNTLSKLTKPASATSLLQMTSAGSPSWLSMGTGVATFIGTPSSSNLAAAITDETGTGSLVFGTSPTFTTGITVHKASNISSILLSSTDLSNTITYSATISSYAEGGYSLKITDQDNFDHMLVSAGNVSLGDVGSLGSLATIVIDTAASGDSNILLSAYDGALEQYNILSVSPTGITATMTSGGTIVLNNITIAAGTNGIMSTKTISASRSGSTVALFDRTTNDGQIISLKQAGTEEGSITVSGTTITYGTFSGSHLGQLSNSSTPNILRGTVIETVDELCEWINESPPEQLVKVKISDTLASNRVYGVFMTWDTDDTVNTHDMLVTSLGAFVVRMAQGIVVQGGDLLESNGDGCARVQSDNVVRASTIGKASSNIVTHTHPDGSYCVPATLYCG